MEFKWICTFTIMLLWALKTRATHFRGGTISWKSLGNRKVLFDFKIGWTYREGPGCRSYRKGRLIVTKLSKKYYWACSSGCPSKAAISSLNYYCSDANEKEDWEQGQNTFRHEFPNDGPFVVSFTGKSWIDLDMKNKGGGPWNVSTTLNLGKRSDTGQANSSPLSLSKPKYDVQLGCEYKLQVPVMDPDGDRVQCRWSAGKECNKVCNALPGAVLDEKNCILHFNTTQSNGYTLQNKGLYAVSLTIEDYPRIPMTLGSAKKTPSDVLSSIPLQYLIETSNLSKACDDKPRFVPQSPEENEVITVEEGDHFKRDLYADNGQNTSVRVKAISTLGIINMKASPRVTQVTSRKNTFKSTLKWKTSVKDIGDHIVCNNVVNTNHISGNPLCFVISVVSKGCSSNPCKNGAKCKSSKGKYRCECRPGFKGQDCETNIDDCVPNACMNGGKCVDGINAVTCNCPKAFTGPKCENHIVTSIKPTVEPGSTTERYTPAVTSGTSSLVTYGPSKVSSSSTTNGPSKLPTPAIKTGESIPINHAVASGPSKLSTPAITSGPSIPITNVVSSGPPKLPTPATTNRLTKLSTSPVTKIHTGQNPCNPTPCKNGGVCKIKAQGFSCECTKGWKGKTCNSVISNARAPILKSVSTAFPVLQQTTTTDRTRNGLSFANDKCPLGDYKCRCVLGPKKTSSESTHTVRYVLIGLFSFPFGIGVSFLTRRLSGLCNTRVKERKNRHKSRPKLFTVTAKTDIPDSPSSANSTTETNDRLRSRDATKE